MEREKMEKLVREALEAEKASYSPYSGFCVGAALLSSSGSVYRGCNVENASYSATNCAERTAVFKAVSEGEQTFTAIAITGKRKMDKEQDRCICVPCGVCLQVLEEFCNPDTFLVILGDGKNTPKAYLLRELLPMGFCKDSL